MDYILVIFNNRTDTMRLYESLRRLGVRSVIVPTPNQLSASCGLSLKVRYSYLNRVVATIKSQGFRSPYRIYLERRGIVGGVYTKII